jgi:hypothetical protein
MTDKAGDMIIPPAFANFSVVSDELIAVRDAAQNLWGLIDFNGNAVTEFLFSSIDIFSHGFAVVEQNRHFGIINTAGEIIVPAEYHGILRFDDYIVVREGNMRGIWRIVP